MIVSDPDQMERLVAKNRNLVWDNGWDVLKITKSPTAMFYKDGRAFGNKWFRTERYALTRRGWTIPDEFFKS